MTYCSEYYFLKQHYDYENKFFKSIINTFAKLEHNRTTIERVYKNCNVGIKKLITVMVIYGYYK